MKKYDAIVIGSGSGMIIVEEALGHGLTVALVDRGPLGGTCANLGCVPSKMLIYAADRAMDIVEAKKLGLSAEISGIDFNFIMDRMRRSVLDTQKHMREGIAQARGLTFYEGVGHFTADYTMKVNGDEIRADKIFIVSGSRPFVPPIPGLEGVDCFTSDTVLQARKKPESIIIIGGGYIGVEYGHFFAAMGTRVTILEMADRLVLPEEPEMAEILKKALSRRMDVRTGTRVDAVSKDDRTGRVTVAVTEKAGAKTEVSAEKVLLAVGRRSNADLLKVENTGVEVNERGFVKVNEHLETTKKNIWATGDANGIQMFTHMANREASLAVHSALHNTRVKMDYSAAPHAVYSRPQMAAVGLTQAQAAKDHSILVGVARYADTAKGDAMMEDEGFAKVIVEKDTNKILGFHIIGPYAPELIQEVNNAMASGGHAAEIGKGIHIHPALSELIPMTLNSLEGA